MNILSVAFFVFYTSYLYYIKFDFLLGFLFSLSKFIMSFSSANIKYKPIILIEL